jgi:serine/threonine-protein kinase HipA
MNNKLAVLEIFLHNQPIGTITRLSDDRNLFAFNQDYIDNPARPTLSLSFEDDLGGIIPETKASRTRLSPFFANVLPEGYMRNYLAARAKVNPEREFFLLAALGNDLPGAIKTGPLTYAETDMMLVQKQEDEMKKKAGKSALHFSLTGVQLKFSATWESESGLTIPINGTGGSWIAKLPSPSFLGVPQNEYVMMELARQIGINVPETDLIPVDQIRGLPKDLERLGTHAFMIKRFDRAENGEAIHMEDFAQIFGVYPEKKYQAASYRNIAEVMWEELGHEGLSEFIRRFVFNALIGNGDMHLKNWSLIYPDKIHPQLAPAYDYVSTLPYLSGESLALNFAHKKKFSSLTMEQFERFATSSNLPKKLVIDTVLETVSRFSQAWKGAGSLSIDEKVADAISKHLTTLPLWAVR